MRKLAYLVPEFPGQTHIFFWREAQALAKLGVRCRWLSTRRPPEKLVVHEWSKQAAAATTYLVPVEPGDLPGIAEEIARAGPRGWLAVARLIAQSEEGPEGRARLLALVAASAKLAHVMRREGLEHVHVHSCARSAYVALFAHALAGIRYSLHLHNPLSVFGPDQRLKWSHAAFALVITEVLERAAREELGSAFPAKVVVAPMGVDLERFRRSSAYEGWRGDRTAGVVSVGRLNPGKGYVHLFRAIRLLVDEGVDVRLDVLGEDDAGGTGFRRTLEASIAELGLEERVTLHGACPEDQVAAHLEAADVYALASPAEPLGVATMEAMAMEVPVVVTTGGGARELVEDGESGRLVPPEDSAALAEAIRSLLESPERARALGVGGRERVLARFSSQRSARALAELLETS